MSSVKKTVVNAMSVDVEDYFQVSAFENTIDRATWDELSCRVEDNTDRLLELFARHDVCATFFVLGWVAERFPALIARIHAAGHEIASHGYEHRLVYEMNPESFRADLRRATAAIQAAAPVSVEGFRAPSFSISEDSLWAYEVLREEGYRYSSSVFPVQHDRYGMPAFSRHPIRLAAGGEAGDESGLRAGAQDGIWEFPMTTWRVLGRNVPAAGGGWLRVLPLGVMHRAIRVANEAGMPAIVYTHPWEIDAQQPRVQRAPRMARLRHYVNLAGTYGRLERLLERHAFGTVSQALAGLETASAAAAPSARSTLAALRLST